MNRKVVDIIIIPPEKILKLCIEKNNADFENNLVPVQFSEKDFIPHLSLFMGVMSPSEESLIFQKLEKITEEFSKIHLSISHIKNNWMFINNTPELNSLQTKIAKNIELYVSHDAISTDFFLDENEEISPDCYPWVNNFFTDYSFEKFSPHITTWTQTPFECPLPLSFQADQIALCHVGRFNTCRNILWKSK